MIDIEHLLSTAMARRRRVSPLACAAILLTSAHAGPPHGPAQGAVPNERVNVRERQLAEAGGRRLRMAWSNFLRSAGTRSKAAPVRRSVGTFLAPNVEKAQEANLPAPERQSLARSSEARYVEPEEIRSERGELHVTLNAAYAHNVIGKDPVHLRAFNGKLVGPTLRVKPGDKLFITLRNRMPGERWRKGMMDTLNQFNTTNLHFHGLHVSPNGNSDNVLIQVGPMETQEYEVDIPKDHTSGTYWYHSHRHGSTAGDVASGMSGALIVEGGLDDVPAIKAAKERVMVLNQIPYINKDSRDGKGNPIDPSLKEGVVEEKYADYEFGPNLWDSMGRFTTVNGVALPVIRMRPGEVERWRVVDSGQRETINLQLLPVPRLGEKPGPAVSLREIANDGLALGKMLGSPSVTLWPGYRSDILVKAPAKGEYLLVDAASSAQMSLNGDPDPTKYIARVVIEGDPHRMPLPGAAELAPLRLPWIKDAQITGRQTAKYGILFKGNDTLFTIDGKTFDMETARELTLNKVDEWTLSTANDDQIWNVTHPFHIHVNPFEVTSIKVPLTDAKGNRVKRRGRYVYIEQLKNGPVWRDTVAIPGGGIVRMRTRYADFIGTFVQHCHILDHEDQGMMELIDIGNQPPLPRTKSLGFPVVGSRAPGFTLPDAGGKPRTLAAVGAGRPMALFFFKGQACFHCAQQLAAFKADYAKFRKRGVQVVGVTSDSPADLKRALASYACPFPVLADPNGLAFAKYGCVGPGGVRHGTFAVDAQGRVLWGTVGSSPYMGLAELLRAFPTGVAKAKAKPRRLAASF